MPRAPTRAGADPLSALRLQVVLVLAAVGFGLTVAAAVSAAVARLHPGCFALPVAGALALAALVLAGLPAHLPHRRLGPANVVTLVRAGATLWLVLPACAPALLAATGWIPLLVGVTLLVLDGVDGRLARATGLASAFGGRLDMEVDAVLILVLSALVYRGGLAGVWVLAAGLLRYAFVAAGALWGWMRSPLPPSRRRQAACVVQTAALVFCLAPGVTPGFAAAVAGLGLATLVLSFAADTLWLYRRRHEGGG